MLKLRRSTNERVLARHHDLAKRFPAVEPVRNAPAGDEDFGILGDIADAEPANAETRGAVPVRPGENTVLPPAKAATARPAAATPLLPNPIPANTVAANPNPNSRVGPPFPPTIPPNMISPTPAATPPSITPSTAPSVPIPPKPVTTSSTSSTASPTVIPQVPQTANRGVSMTPSGTAAPETSASPTDSTSSSSSKGISSGAVGGIVAVVVIAVLLVIAFFVRKNYQRRRALKRNTWGAGLVPSLETKRQTMYDAGEKADRPVSPYGGVPEHQRLANVPPSVMSQAPAQRALTVPPALATGSSIHNNPYGAYPDITLPASAYNASPFATPVSPFAAPSLQAPSVRSLTPAAPTGELAIVARTFIPTLPDELHISNGEQIRILSAYDDGWALCANPRGEQGVVPLECLDRRGGAPTEMQLQPHSGIGNENRTSRRMSSLAPVAPGTY